MPKEDTGAHGRQTLSVEAILDSATALLEDGRQEFSLRELGAALGVHNTAFYRYFRDKNELLRAAADRILAPVADAAADIEEPFDGVVAIVTALREVLLGRPAAARVLAQGPARQINELRLTEEVLRLLREGGLSDQGAVDAYHALIEFAVGSSVIDQPVASLSAEERAETYRGWRADYLALDAAHFPHLLASASLMYRDASDQFTFGLRLMVDSLRRLAESPQS